MTDELSRRLTEEVDAATPDTLAPFSAVVARRARRRARRRVAVVAAAVVAVGAVASTAALAGGDPDGRGGAPVATSSPRPSAEHSLAVPRGEGDAPPPIVLRGTGPQVEARQGSYCWSNACVDTVGPATDELPELGPAATVLAGFADPGATWTVSLASERPCGLDYPVRLTPAGPGIWELTPSGPGGDHRLDLFLYPSDGGDTSGAAMWTTAPAPAPQSWAHLHQNGRWEGGGGVVRVVLDGAAVDGGASATVTVSGASETATFDLVAQDQGCPGDRYVTLAPRGPVDRRVDGLGEGPFTYDVDVVVDGRHHHASATSVEGAEDTPLVFTPALPE